MEWYPRMFKSLFQYIEENLERKIDIEDAAKAAGYSASHLHRLFTFAYGISVADYIRKRKLTNSLPLLLDRRKSMNSLFPVHLRMNLALLPGNTA